MADTTAPEVTTLPTTPTLETAATTPPVTEAATTTTAPTLKRGGSNAFFNRMAQEFDTQAKAPTGAVRQPDPKRDIEAKDTVEATPAPVSDKTANPVVAAVDAPVTKLATASDVEPQKTDAAEPEPDELTKTKSELATLKKEREDALEAANSLQLDRDSQAALNKIAAKIAQKDQTYANLKTSFDEAVQKLDDDDPVLQRLAAEARTAWDESQELRQTWGQQKTYFDQQAQVKRKETITKGVTGLLKEFELEETELKKVDPKLDTVNNSLGTMKAALLAQQKKYEKRIAALETEAKSAAEKAEEAARKKWSQESPASLPPPIGGNGGSPTGEPTTFRQGNSLKSLDNGFAKSRR